MNNATTTPTHHHYFDNFRAGVTACLRSWSVLRTAVDAGWGPAAAADDLRANIWQHTPGMGDVTDLEDALAIYMEEEFALQLEDGSEKHVADVIWRLYQDCVVQQSTVLLRQVLATAERAASHQLPVHLQESEYDDDDDDTMETTTEATITTAPALATNTPVNNISSLSAAEYANQPLFGSAPQPQAPQPAKPVRQLGQDPQIGETNGADDTEMVDEDGFAPVVKRKPQRRQINNSSTRS